MNECKCYRTITDIGAIWFRIMLLAGWLWLLRCLFAVCWHCVHLWWVIIWKIHTIHRQNSQLYEETKTNREIIMKHIICIAIFNIIEWREKQNEKQMVEIGEMETGYHVACTFVRGGSHEFFIFNIRLLSVTINKNDKINAMTQASQVHYAIAIIWVLYYM